MAIEVRGAAEFAAKLVDLSSATKPSSGWQRAVGRKMAQDASQFATRIASSDLGGDPKFSGWAPTLDTKHRIGSDGAVIFSPTRQSAGPWTVAERGRNQSTSMLATPNFGAARGTSRISAKTGKVVKGRARKQRRWNGRTAGKGTATKVVAVVTRNAERVYRIEFAELIRSKF